MDEFCVELPFDGMYWRLHPYYKEEDGVKVIQFQWGWTAGMSEEDKKNIADDAPTECDSVSTTFEDAIELRDKLTELIEKHKNDIAPETDVTRRLDELNKSIDWDKLFDHAKPCDQ